jgi:hypothetical protein
VGPEAKISGRSVAKSLQTEAKISGRSVAKSLQTYRIPRSAARSASWQQGPRQRALFT